MTYKYAMSRTTFKEFLTALNEASYCDSIKDPVIRKACKNLNKKSYKVRMYGSIGPGRSNGSGSGPGPGTGGGQGPGTGTGGGAFGGPGGAGGAFGSGGSGGGSGGGGV